MDEKHISRVEFARAMGLSRARVTQLVARGLPTGSDGCIPEQAGKSWYQTYIRASVKLVKSEVTATPRCHGRAVENAISAPPPTTEASSPRAETIASIQFQREKLKLMEQELDLQERQGKLIDVDQVRTEQFNRAMAEREALLTWPLRVSAEIASHLGVSQLDVFNELSREVRQFLTERSRVQPPDAENGVA